MKKQLLAFCMMAFSTSLFSQTLAGDTCITVGGAGNIVAFVNYDGGVLNINIDQNIPNLKIGICTYEPVTINLSGPYLANVTEVRYAGYVSTTNHHCANSPVTTTIVGAPGGAATSVNFLPPATLANPNGYSSIVCGYTCDNNSNQGGCNTADQIQDYFVTSMGGTMNSYFTQYGCWSVTPYNISAGGNCPVGAVTDTTSTLFSSSASTVCTGVPVNFTDLSPGAVSWTWTATGSSIPTSTSQHLTGVIYNTPGTFSVTLATNDGSGNCSATQTITVIASPSINALATPNPICNTDTTVLSATGGISYTWSPAGPGMVTPSIPTMYIVNGIAANGCSGTDSILVNVFATPSAPSIIYAAGLLTASPTATSYQWYLNGVIISGANSSTYTPIQNGLYTVELVDANGCTSLISSATMVADMGIDNPLLMAPLKIFPNPGSGIFQITTPAFKNQEVLIEVIDIMGRVVVAKKVIMFASYLIDVSGQAKGVYQIRLTEGKTIVTGKLLLQ